MSSSNLSRGIQLFEINRYPEAIKYLQAALHEDINNWSTKYYLGLCYYNIDEYTKAEGFLDSLLLEEPDNEYVHSLKSNIELQRNKLAEALKHIDLSISLNPTEANFFGQKSAILLHKKEFELGLSFANKGLAIDPKNNYCLNLRTQFLTKLNRIEEANLTIEHLLFDNPNDVYSQANVGWVELEKGNHEKAMTHFKEALILNPNMQYARNGMSTALKAKNIFYKWFLKYQFWMTNKSSKNQWIFILGIYFAYRFSVKVLSASGMSYLALPLIIVYLLFALGGWIMEPISNMILNFNNYGKYLLSKSEKLSGISFGTLTILSLISIIIFLTTSNHYFLILAISFICSLIPLPRAFLQDSKKAKNFGISYGILILLVGLFGSLIVPNHYTIGFAVFILMIAFTWIGSLVK